MAAATENSKKNILGIPGLWAIDLTFAADADTYASKLSVDSFQWSVVSATGADAQFIQISESGGTFTINVDTEVGGTKATAFILWVLEKK